MFIEWKKLTPPAGATSDVLFETLKLLVTRLNEFLAAIARELSAVMSGYEADVVWNPPSVAAGASTYLDVSVPGAKLGMKALAGFSLLLPDGVDLTAKVKATDVVRVRLENETGGAVDLAIGTLSVSVLE